MVKTITITQTAAHQKTAYEYKNKPKTPVNPDINGIHFCIRAMSRKKNDTRAHVTHLYVRDDKMAGTNGSRLHEYALKAKIPKGFYSVAVKLKNYVVLLHEDNIPTDYPQWFDLFPEKENYNIDKENPRNTIITGKDIHVTLYQLNRMANCPLNYEYIEDLEDEMILRHHKEDIDMFIFSNHNETMRAAIMGLKW